MEKDWRLIIDAALEPEMNMAVDEAIMLMMADGLSTPTLRIYRWLEPCVSLGRLQRAEDVIPAGTRVGVVRRPTGGGLVSHGEEGLTYSLIYRESSGCVDRGVAASYLQVHEAVVSALVSLGARAYVYRPPLAPDKPSGACFESPVASDVMADGRKVAGAAQRRRKDVVLHQGEVSLCLDVLKKWSYNVIQTAFINSLSERLNARFIESRISEKEKRLAGELFVERTEEVTR